MSSFTDNDRAFFSALDPKIHVIDLLNKHVVMKINGELCFLRVGTNEIIVSTVEGCRIQVKSADERTIIIKPTKAE